MPDSIALNPTNPITWAIVFWVVVFGLRSLWSWYTKEYLPYRMKSSDSQTTFQQTQEQQQDQWYRQLIERQFAQQSETLVLVNNQLIELTKQMLRMTELQNVSMQLHAEHNKMLTVQHQLLTNTARRGATRTTTTNIAAQQQTVIEPNKEPT